MKGFIPKKIVFLFANQVKGLLRLTPLTPIGYEKDVPIMG
jgi:hypothetical protein